MSEYLRAASWERTARHTIEALLLPWNLRAQVFDVLDDGTVDRYWEGFRPGAADPQTLSANKGTINRIVVKDQHRGGLGKVGHTVSLANTDAGLHAVGRILPSFVDDVDAMLEEGVDGVSAEFHPLGRPDLDSAGTRWRSRVQLVAWALEAEPAYATARVLAVRAAEEATADEATAVAARQAELAELDVWLAGMRDKGSRFVS